MGWTHHHHSGIPPMIWVDLDIILVNLLAFHHQKFANYFWLLIYHLHLVRGLVLLLLYLHGNLFRSAHLTICHCGRLLIVIISLCRGVASLGIFYILIGQVDRSWGAGEEVRRFVGRWLVR